MAKASSNRCNWIISSWSVRQTAGHRNHRANTGFIRCRRPCLWVKLAKSNNNVEPHNKIEQRVCWQRAVFCSVGWPRCPRSAESNVFRGRGWRVMDNCVKPGRQPDYWPNLEPCWCHRSGQRRTWSVAVFTFIHAVVASPAPVGCISLSFWLESRC